MSPLSVKKLTCLLFAALHLNIAKGKIAKNAQLGTFLNRLHNKLYQYYLIVFLEFNGIKNSTLLELPTLASDS